jgi:DNA-damage-inducible protein J
MGKTAVITVRIDPELKQTSEQIFHRLGLTTSEAITMFLRQVSLQRGLSFMLKTPNAMTTQALQEAQLRQNLKSFTDTEELFTDCGIR